MDDSIVRGTTSPKIVKMVRDAGAKEVHVPISPQDRRQAELFPIRAEDGD